MNEQSARKLLPDYLRGFLTEKQISELEAVLSASPTLRQECDDLRAYFEGLDSLGPQKAPADFLDTLHARLQRRPWPTRLWQWLVHPAPFKLPLEIAGVAVTCLLIVAIYLPWTKQSVAPVAMKDESPAAKAAPTALDLPKAEELALQSAVPPAVTEKKSLAATRSIQAAQPPAKVTASKAKAAPPAQPAKTQRRADLASAHTGYGGGVAASKPPELRPEPVDELSDARQAYAMAAAPAPAAPQQEPLAPQPTTEAVMAEQKAEPAPLICLALTLRQSTPERSQKAESRRMARSAAPATLDAEERSVHPAESDESPSSTARIEAILRSHQATYHLSSGGAAVEYSIDLPASQLPSLKRALAALGALRETSGTHGGQTDGSIRIRLTIARR